jgi:cytochrome oxidase Cu insertion factor (SCO1/SenC/PrrC family)
VTLRLWGLALVVGVVLPALFVLTVRQQWPGATSTAGPARVLPDFALEDQDGRLIRTRDLRGKPVVVSFFFTGCKSACPLSAAHLVRLQQALAAEDVAFVSFSIDPERDGPAVRRAYAERWAPAERRWSLLAPSDAALADIAVGLGLDARAAAGVHTTALLLLEPGGAVYRTWPPATPLADELAAVYSLLRRHAWLTHSPSAAPSTGHEVARINLAM